MNLFNTASAKNLQTTHLINQHTVHAAPVLALPPEDKTSLFRRSIQHNYADLLKIAEDSDMAIGLTDHHGTLLWTWSSSPMLSSAEQVHFIEGGFWLRIFRAISARPRKSGTKISIRVSGLV